jgi:DNA-binding response OmpR family regulator
LAQTTRAGVVANSIHCQTEATEDAMRTVLIAHHIVCRADFAASPEYLKVFVSRLRAKLRRPGVREFIEAERGRGYRFVRRRELAS